PARSHDSISAFADLFARLRDHDGVLALLFAPVGYHHGVLPFDHIGLGDHDDAFALFFLPFGPKNGACALLLARVGDHDGALALFRAPMGHVERLLDFALLGFWDGAVDGAFLFAVRRLELRAIEGQGSLLVANRGRPTRCGTMSARE